ncbi:MAG: hypothetical protein K1W24_12880 [Lachnospiraceae bacterium]
MAKEKFSDDQKRSIAKLNPSGLEQIDSIKVLFDKPVCRTTIYKAKANGNLLNRLDDAEKARRKCTVENELLKIQVTSLTLENEFLKQKRSGKPAVFFKKKE